MTRWCRPLTSCFTYHLQPAKIRAPRRVCSRRRRHYRRHCPRFLLKRAPGSLPEARPSTHRPQRRLPPSPPSVAPSLSRQRHGWWEVRADLAPSPRCALRPMSWHSGYNSEHGLPPGISHELYLSLAPPWASPNANPNPKVTLTLTNPPPPPRCARRVTSWHRGCNSEPSPPLRRARIAQQAHHLDIDPPETGMDRSPYDLSVLGSVEELLGINYSSQTEGCSRRSLARALR